MALTQNFKHTIKLRVNRDAQFRETPLRESIENMLAGDLDTGKAILGDYINATVGFTELAQATHQSRRSLIKMLGPKGNPQAQNLFQILVF